MNKFGIKGTSPTYSNYQHKESKENIKRQVKQEREEKIKQVIGKKSAGIYILKEHGRKILSAMKWL